MIHSLSESQAQKLILLSQGLSTPPNKGRALDKSLSVIEQLGYVQIDTISVVQRAHHHVFWSRNPNYQVEQLDKLVADKTVFEYWSHAAAYLPMSDFRFSLRRKHAIKTDKQNHWYRKDRNMMASILLRIKEEGPLLAKDFESVASKSGGWGSKPTKQALENLFMQGDLMIAERRNFHKVYDLTERVLPDGIDLSMPSSFEQGKFLVQRFLNAHGIASVNDMTYLLKGAKESVQDALSKLQENGDVAIANVNGNEYFVRPDVTELLNKRLSKKRAIILSPFDNILIQRKRAKTFFDFDYQLECYVPAAKRQHGYFCLPILWDGRLVARADCKVDKQLKVLNVSHLILESKTPSQSGFEDALEQALQKFAQFNHCESYRIQKQTRIGS